jgi:hypothetical protein
MIAEIEAGRRRVDVLELFQLAAAIDFAPAELIVELAAEIGAADV